MTSRFQKRLKSLESEGIEDSWGYSLWLGQIDIEDCLFRNCVKTGIVAAASLASFYGISELVSRHPEYIKLIKNYLGL